MNPDECTNSCFDEDYNEYLEMVNNLNIMFDNIKYNAYEKYKRFDSTIINSISNWNFEYKLDHATFRVGKHIYRVIPVGTCTNNKIGNSETGFIAHDEYHPSGRKYRDVCNVIKDNKLPSIFVEGDEIGEGAADGFKFGYMLSSIVCQKIGAKGFASVTLTNGIQLWFVIISGINASARNTLKVIEDNVVNILVLQNAADVWYSYVKMENLVVKKR